MLRDWFDAWLHSHLSIHAVNYRLPDADSDAGSKLYGAWKKEMIRAGVMELSDADVASQQLILDAPHPNQHFKRFLKLAADARLERLGNDAPSKGDGSDREHAYRESRDCPDCCGEGRTYRYRHAWPSRPGTPREVLFYCTCPMGGWMKNAHRLGPDRRAHYPDLRDRPDLQLGPVAWSVEADNKHRWPPDLWDAENDRPIPRRYVRSVDQLVSTATRPPPERRRNPPAWEPSPSSSSSHAAATIAVESLPDEPF